MKYLGRKCEVPGCDHPKADSQGRLEINMIQGVHAICRSCQTKATAYYIEKMEEWALAMNNYKESVEAHLNAMADGHKPDDVDQDEDFSLWAAAQAYEDWTNFIERTW